MPSAQHDLPGGIVNDLAGHGKQREFRFEPLDGRGFQREEVEEQGAVAARRQTRHLAFGRRVGHLYVRVDLFQVGGFAALGRTVVNDLELQFLGGSVDDGHGVCGLRS
jgi:hypothetical protein